MHVRVCYVYIPGMLDDAQDHRKSNIFSEDSYANSIFSAPNLLDYPGILVGSNGLG